MVARRTGHRTRRAPGGGQAWACPLFLPPGAAGGSALKAGLGVYVCQAASQFAVALGPQPALTLRGGPVSLRGASPGPERGSIPGVSGGEAASWFWAAQRPAAVTRPPSAPLPAPAHRPQG